MGELKKPLLCGSPKSIYKKSSINVEESLKNITQYREKQHEKLKLAAKDKAREKKIKHKRKSSIPLGSFLRAKKIIQLFKKDKIHLKRNLKLDNLSKKIGVHRTIISNDFKINFNKEFNHVKNYYRILFFIENFNRDEFLKFTLCYMANQSGYNTGHSLYVIFKKVMGIDLSKYKNMVVNETLPKDFIIQFKKKNQPFSE